MHYQRKLSGTLDRPRPRAKLTEDKVRTIRRECASADGIGVVLLVERFAERYGVSISTISRVLARATWADLGDLGEPTAQS